MKNEISSNTTQETIESTNKTILNNNLKQKFAISVLCIAVASSSFVSSSVNAQDAKQLNEHQYEQTTANDESSLNAQDKEGIGFGVGMVIGAVVAGPIGAFVTGIAGNIIAKNINANDEIDVLANTLDEEKLEHQQLLSAATKNYEIKLQQVEQAHEYELLAQENNYKSNEQIKAEQLLMSLQFSTGSSDIAPHYQEQVAVLAQLLNSDENLQIDLSGYTDLQGDEVLNQKLSLARVNTVKTLLMAQGVEESRIQTFAFGDKAPLVANSNKKISFYDRRVVLEVKNTSSQTAKN